MIQQTHLHRQGFRLIPRGLVVLPFVVSTSAKSVLKRSRNCDPLQKQLGLRALQAKKRLEFFEQVSSGVSVPDRYVHSAMFGVLRLPTNHRAAAGRAMAWALEVPAIGVHHMEGHLLAPLMEENPPKPPFVALLVSGGHTQLVLVKAIGDYQLLGETLDDAAGEAFDKTAKTMGLPYPGGPELAKLAETGKPGKYKFSRPMTDRPGLDFSFSGLKTQVLLAWQKSDKTAETRADIARGFEDAVVDTLAVKCERALRECGSNILVVAGGVGANKRLRAKLAVTCEKLGGQAYFPRSEFCTDNGAMIAFAGALRLTAGQHESAAITVQARWDMATLSLVD